MANINIKTNFVDGEKLFAQQLNNNFKTIQEGMNADNKIIWQDGEEVLFKRYITNDIENLPIVDGAIIYDIEKGRHYIDYNGERIQVGSAGKEVLVQDTQPIEEDNKIWIESDFVNSMGTEVVDSLDGDETNMSPSVRVVKESLLDAYSTEEVKTNKVWIDRKPIYRKVVNMGNLLNNGGKSVKHGLSNFVIITTNGSATNGSIHVGISGFNDEIYIDNTNVIWTTKADRRSFTAYVVLEYTKTTDSEVISNEI